MSTEFTPATIDELENWMQVNCFNFDSYSINGNSILEGCGIDKWGSLFIWYYTERGQRNNLKYFQTEREIVEYAFKEILPDKWANTHCVGFTTIKSEQNELATSLGEIEIEYIQDEIPGFYGLDRSAFRTFVFGCDIEKVKHLKAKYYRENF